MPCITMTPYTFSSICILPNWTHPICWQFGVTLLLRIFFHPSSSEKNSTHPHGSNANIASFVKASSLFFHSVIWTLVSWHSSIISFIVLQDKSILQMCFLYPMFNLLQSRKVVFFVFIFIDHTSQCYCENYA